MKFIYLILITVLALPADEIKRIESIVQDISKLRVAHEKCEQTLVAQDVNIKKYKENMINLESEIKFLKKQLKSKENTRKNTVDVKKEKVKTKVKTINTMVYQKCDENNPFPKLIMKEDSLDVKNLPSLKTSKPKYFKASTFRLNKSADIYNAMNGEAIDSWENETSFTSNQRTAKWLKITGYFVDKAWRKAESEMWVRSSNATKR